MRWNFLYASIYGILLTGFELLAWYLDSMARLFYRWEEPEWWHRTFTNYDKENSEVEEEELVDDDDWIVIDALEF